MKPFLSLLQFVLRREVENTCDQCYERSDYGVLEQQHDHSCILGLVLLYFALIMQRDGEWKPFLSVLQFVLRREVESTCDQCYKSKVYPRNEDQNAVGKGQEPSFARLLGGQDSRSHGGAVHGFHAFNQEEERNHYVCWLHCSNALLWSLRQWGDVGWRRQASQGV